MLDDKPHAGADAPPPVTKIPNGMEVSATSTSSEGSLPPNGERGRDTSFVERSDTHATLQPSVEKTHGTTGRRARRGRDRRGKFVRVTNPYGRYPFSALSEDYLGALHDHRAPLTLEQLRRDLNTINTDAHFLHERGKLSTMNPRNLTVDDIGALLGYWRVRRKRGKGAPDGTLSGTSQVHLFRALKGFLAFCGNGAVGQLKTKPQYRLPKPSQRPPETLAPEQLKALRLAVEGYEGWWGDVARFLVRFAPATGLRPKELRLQDLTCIDFEHNEVLVCHPKGEGAWNEAHSETAPISDDGMLALRDFMDARERYLKGDYTEALIPFRHADGSLGYWSEAMMRKVKKQIEKRAGVRFHLKTFRATFGQIAIDQQAPLDAVSVSMRHRTTATTERYYARKQVKQAHAEVREALAKVAN